MQVSARLQAWAREAAEQLKPMTVWRYVCEHLITLSPASDLPKSSCCPRKHWATAVFRMIQDRPPQHRAHRRPIRLRDLRDRLGLDEELQPMPAQPVEEIRRIGVAQSDAGGQGKGGIEARPSRLVMEDALRPGNSQCWDYERIRLRDLPDKVFSKDYLKKLQ